MNCQIHFYKLPLENSRSKIFFTGLSFIKNSSMPFVARKKPCRIFTSCKAFFILFSALPAAPTASQELIGPTPSHALSSFLCTLH